MRTILVDLIVVQFKKRLLYNFFEI